MRSFRGLIFYPKADTSGECARDVQSASPIDVALLRHGSRQPAHRAGAPGTHRGVRGSRRVEAESRPDVGDKCCRVSGQVHRTDLIGPRADP